MAEFSCNGLDDLMLSLQEIESIPDDVKDEILNAEADVLVPEIRDRGKGYGIPDGKMLQSIKKGKVRTSKKGNKAIPVYAAGSRTRGKKRIKNSEIAFLNNYGTRHQQARPFWSDTEELSAKTMTAAGERIVNKWLLSKDL